MRFHKTVSALCLSAALCMVGVSPVFACLNDRDSDSLASEGGKLPQVVSVITGRFERNPPLYYQMRRARVAREIAAHPTRWNLYDDAAVASDRLHDEEAALGWIEKKRAGMQRAGVTPATAEGEEAWYRYHANVGTFLAHRYLNNGATPKRVGEMQTAITHIEKALALKPDAHFGRERYQLGAMRWIADLRGNGGKLANPHPVMGLLAFTGAIVGSEVDYPSAVEGLSGLVALGNAWESVDVFGSLAHSLNRAGDGKIAYLAQLRCEELLRAGRRSFDPSLKGDAQATARRLTSSRRGVTNEPNLRDKYAQLRAAADNWQAERTVFMMARLKAGQHPDTTPGFWGGFRPTPAPPLEMAWSKEAGDNFSNWMMRNLYALGLVFLLVLIVAPFGLYHAARHLRRWVDARKPEPSL